MQSWSRVYRSLAKVRAARAGVMLDSQAQRCPLVGPDAACRREPPRPRLYAGSVRPPEAAGSASPD